MTAGGRYPGVIKDLLGSGTIGPTLCLGIVVRVGGNNKYSRGKPCSITKADHR